ncbi:MAG TPA: hypothetical protein VIM15_01300 [Gemmatimonadaceae bacterium]
MAVMENHVHALSFLRKIVHAKELHDGGALAAFASRIELTNSQKFGGLAPRSWLPDGAANHCWKAVEVRHVNSLRDWG